MKKFRFFMILCLVFSALTLNAKDNKDKKQDIAEVTFSVNLHCHSCVEKIQSQVSYMKGVTDLEVSLDEHTVWIKFKKSKTGVDVLAREFQRMGYDVKVLAAKNVPGFEEDSECGECEKDGKGCCDDDDDDCCGGKEKDNCKDRD